MADRLRGKVAVVTGASSGNGRAIARIFAQEGASVMCADLQQQPRSGGSENNPEVPTDELIRACGGEAAFATTEVTCPDQVVAAVEEAMRRYGRLDVMVNNAGIYSGLASLTEEDEATFDRHVATHLKGTWAGSRAAIVQFRRQGDGGRIINVSSVGGLVALAREPGYSASKAAVVNLTRQVALDYGREGITCNAICPGYIVTAMTRSMLEDARIRRSIEDATPCPRLGCPDDIGHAALYLASDEAAFVNGAALVVDGGWMAGEHFRHEA
jgi:NAD(P)-dependent dehydrogenase (short-subunit alcohol dehydrogenase family)